MCLSLYALLLRMLVIDLHVHAKNQHNICNSIEKTVPLVKFSKCKTRNFAKNH